MTLGACNDEGMREPSSPVTTSLRDSNDLCVGLPAMCAADARVLVLGSMPGSASLQQARYYAHPRNRFWPLMAELAGVAPALSYGERLAALQQAGIGLWDVIGQCRRTGSLDADIVRGSEVPNALPSLIAGLPGLHLVACNGATAYRAFQRFIIPQLSAPPRWTVLSLPSTSPANAAFSLDRLRAAWQPVARYRLPDD